VKRNAVYSLSEEETLDLGKRLARGLRPGDLVLLVGDLGLGKTVLARGIADGFGVDPAEVSSPTFTLVQEYRGGRLPLFHVDLYRLSQASEAEELGIDELLDAGAVVVVEWGERLPERLRRGALTVRFIDVGEDARRIEFGGRADVGVPDDA